MIKLGSISLQQIAKNKLINARYKFDKRRRSIATLPKWQRKFSFIAKMRLYSRRCNQKHKPLNIQLYLFYHKKLIGEQTLNLINLFMKRYKI